MKKFTCFIVIFAICIMLCAGCKKDTSETAVNWPLKEVNTVYDRYGNILQQVIYNEASGEYFIKEYTWSLYNNKWVCVDQSTTLIDKRDSCQTNSENTSRALSIYYKYYLAEGPIILIDNADIKVSIVESLNAASWWEFGYKFKVENKSNKTITIMFDNVSILNIQCSPMFFVDHLEPGNTIYFNLAWDLDSLKRSCIPYIDNVEFLLKVYDADDWNRPAIYGTRALIKN